MPGGVVSESRHPPSCPEYEPLLRQGFQPSAFQRSRPRAALNASCSRPSHLVPSPHNPEPEPRRTPLRTTSRPPDSRRSLRRATHPQLPTEQELLHHAWQHNLSIRHMPLRLRAICQDVSGANGLVPGSIRVEVADQRAWLIPIGVLIHGVEPGGYGDAARDCS